MKIFKKKISSCLILKFSSFKDFRGKYIETFNEKKYKKRLKIKFVQDDFSYSKKNVLRGFHGDEKTWKLFKCIKGKIQFAVVNNDKESKNYKKNFSIILSESDNYQVLIPPKHGCAHLVLSDYSILHYKQSTYYKDFPQFTVNYKSKCLNFKWKSKNIVVSKRDKGGIVLD